MQTTTRPATQTLGQFLNLHGHRIHATAPRPVTYTNTFGTNIEFINDQWYNIFWSKTFNSYHTEGNQFIEKLKIGRLGTLANFLKT
jgi:hypothetical protein